MRAKKQLGQHFLTSTAAVAKIVAAGEVAAGETILEIGPGKGVLTKALLNAGGTVIGIEKDQELLPLLRSTFEKEIEDGRLILIEGDVLEIPLQKILGGSTYKLIANIPYYITGELLRKFLETSRQPSRIVFLVQKEVAERIIARDGKESLLSLSVKVYGAPKMMGIVKAGSFSPPPTVDSAILSITNISKKAFKNMDESRFFKLLHAGFAHKRKMLLPNLITASLGERENLENAFKKLNISTKTRSEDLQLAQWLDLHEEMFNP